MAERLAAALARTGFTVVSGLARGVDAAAHRGAIGAGGRSIGVMANGLSTVYPPEHEDLARALSETGAIISEMPMRQVPLPGLFTQRNRIISGIALGVVVVEATLRSGSLSTARHAMEQNREVFAVPGPADSLSSRGCHRLIRDGARLVETVDDIIDELGPLVRRDQGRSRRARRTTPSRARAFGFGAIAPGSALRPAVRRRRADRSHRNDRRPGAGHAQRARGQAPGEAPRRAPVRACLNFELTLAARATVARRR